MKYLIWPSGLGKVVELDYFLWLYYNTKLRSLIILYLLNVAFDICNTPLDLISTPITPCHSHSPNVIEIELLIEIPSWLTILIVVVKISVYPTSIVIKYVDFFIFYLYIYIIDITFCISSQDEPFALRTLIRYILFKSQWIVGNSRLFKVWHWLIIIINIFVNS